MKRKIKLFDERDMKFSQLGELREEMIKIHLWLTFCITFLVLGIGIDLYVSGIARIICSILLFVMGIELILLAFKILKKIFRGDRVSEKRKFIIVEGKPSNFIQLLEEKVKQGYKPIWQTFRIYYDWYIVVCEAKE